MFSFSCDICGVDMATARIRTPNEPLSAAWNYEAVGYEEECQHCTTVRRTTIDAQVSTPPPPSPCWPDCEDEDDNEWLPSEQSESDRNPLTDESGAGSDSSGCGSPPRRSYNASGCSDCDSDGNSEDSKYDGTPMQYPLSDLFAPSSPERLPHGSWYNGALYYSGNRQYPQREYMPDVAQNMPLEHIASPSCQSSQGINGHVLSLAQMKNCRNVRFLVPKSAYWKTETIDQLLEEDSLVDLDGLWHWREIQSHPDLYGVGDRVPLRRPQVERARERWDSPWRHLAGDEWLAANPVEIPGMYGALKACMSRPNGNHTQQPAAGLLALPAEIIHCILSALDPIDVDTVVKTCGSLYEHAQPVFKGCLYRDMRWLWEVVEGSEYPASPDRPATWDPLCPSGQPLPTLPVGLESEEAEDAIWATIVAEDPEMEGAARAAKALNRLRREEIFGPYYARQESSLREWQSFRADVDAWVRSRRYGATLAKEKTNWRRLWWLCNSATTPLPGLRNRARIWDDCNQIMDVVSLARDSGEVDKRLGSLHSRLSDPSQPGWSTNPEVDDWF
ncbi:uncharacterized protein PG998_011691 [Apiospora kogelbergensis]|uniref:uncharacterized protein n=1 Tax=Apiospora kogelbergensis TaxID=1337665 RepID=UPI00312D838D